MFWNQMNSFVFMLGVATLSWIVTAADNAVGTPYTLIRIAAVTPGPRLAIFMEPMSGMQCVKHCHDTPHCTYIVTRPVAWASFDKINENKDLSFMQKLKKNDLLGCWLFASRGNEEPGQSWIGRGMKEMSMNGEWRYGDVLLASKRWADKATGKFNPEHFVAQEETDRVRYADPAFRRELENQGLPDCARRTPLVTPEGDHFTDAISDAVSTSPSNKPTSDGPEETSSTLEADSTSSKEGSESSPPSTATETSPSTTQETIPTTQDTRTTTLYSYVCRGNVYTSFDIVCDQQYSMVRQISMAKESATMDPSCPMLGLMEDMTGNIVETFDGALGFCSTSSCGKFIVPIGKNMIYIPQLAKYSAVYEKYGKNDVKPLCYAFSVTVTN